MQKFTHDFKQCVRDRCLEMLWDMKLLKNVERIAWFEKQKLMRSFEESWEIKSEETSRN